MNNGPFDYLRASGLEPTRWLREGHNVVRKRRGRLQLRPQSTGQPGGEVDNPYNDPINDTRSGRTPRDQRRFPHHLPGSGGDEGNAAPVTPKPQPRRSFMEGSRLWLTGGDWKRVIHPVRGRKRRG